MKLRELASTEMALFIGGGDLPSLVVESLNKRGIPFILVCFDGTKINIPVAQRTVLNASFANIAQLFDDLNKMNIKKDSAGKLDLFVDGKKKISISNKSTSGKVLEYNLTLSFNISIKDNLKGNTVFTKNISETRNYKPSNTYSETVTNEKKIIEDTSDFVAKQIVNEVTLILRNDI